MKTGKHPTHAGRSTRKRRGGAAERRPDRRGVSGKIAGPHTRSQAKTVTCKGKQNRREFDSTVPR